MIQYPHIDPVAIRIAGFSIYWYGVLYLIGFMAIWLLGSWRAQRMGSGWTKTQFGDLVFYCALGVIIGGRLGYVVFYDLPYFLQHPLEIFAVWQGGMSFHGGFIGVLCVLWMYSHHLKRSMWEITDFIAPLVPIGLAAGRIGNFINGELWGRITSVPWGMVFPAVGPQPRHPSQIYEFLLEGIILFLILWTYSSKPRPRFAVSALFLLSYGVLRTISECFRQPDPQYGFIAFGWLTMGQLLSLPMILLGGIFLIVIYRRQES